MLIHRTEILEMFDRINDDAEVNKTTALKNDKEEKPLLGHRWILIILGFTLYFIDFFVRNSFPVALVAMVNSTEPETEVSRSGDQCIPGVNVTEGGSMEQNKQGEYYWDSSEQGIILGAYFWGFICTKIFASRVGEIIGQREVIAFGVAASGLLVFSVPVAASISPYALAAVRFLCGACFGPTPAAMHSLLSAWAPRKELSSMVTTVESGLGLGGMSGLVIAGWLTENFGWKIIFWIGGSLCLIFLPFWIILVRNSPQNHPWLSSYEARLLEGNKNVTTKKTVPWLKLLFSPYVLICVLCHFVRTVLDVILTTEGPSFFTYRIGLKLNIASYVCGGSYLSSVLLALVFGRISDFLIRHKYLSTIHTRKLFHFIGCVGASITLIGVVFAGCNSKEVIILWIITGGILGANVCSYIVSVIDIAPNYSATVIGITGLGNFGAAITPIVTSTLLNQQNGWNKTFLLASGISLLSCLVYVPFMTAEAQPWNFYN